VLLPLAARLKTAALAPPCRARRLGVSRHDLTPGRRQCGQRRHGKFGSAHEDHAHGVQKAFRLMGEALSVPPWHRQEIEALANALARLPGLGPRSARRAAPWLIKRRETGLTSNWSTP